MKKNKTEDRQQRHSKQAASSRADPFDIFKRLSFHLPPFPFSNKEDDQASFFSLSLALNLSLFLLYHKSAPVLHCGRLHALLLYHKESARPLPFHLIHFFTRSLARSPDQSIFGRSRSVLPRKL